MSADFLVLLLCVPLAVASPLSTPGLTECGGIGVARGAVVDDVDARAQGGAVCRQGDPDHPHHVKILRPRRCAGDCARG